MMNDPLIGVLSSSLLACLVTTIGIYSLSRHASWGNRNVVYFMSFAAGILISVSFIHIIPKSFEMNEKSPIFLLLGFMALHLVNRYLTAYVCNEKDCRDISFGIIPMVGIGLHSFIDGIIYSVTFNVGIYTGVLAAVGMVLHEFPEGIVTFLLLERAGFSRKKSIGYAFLAAGFSTPLGAMISFPFISRIREDVMGLFLAISAGALVYVGASHLLPSVQKENRRFTMIAMTVGILFAVLIVLSKG